MWLLIHAEINVKPFLSKGDLWWWRYGNQVNKNSITWKHINCAKIVQRAANSEECGPENDIANFLYVLLTKPYSVDMVELQQTRRHSPPGKTKNLGFPIFVMGGLMRTLPWRARECVMNLKLQNLQGIGVSALLFSLDTLDKPFAWKQLRPHARANFKLKNPLSNPVASDLRLHNVHVMSRCYLDPVTNQ